MKRLWIGATACALLLGGCAGYQALPLPSDAQLAHDASHVTVPTAAMPTPAMRAHRYDPSDGFDMTEVAMLAVVNNPELRLMRAEAGVTRAQAFSAGLLPDPQLALGSDRVLGSPVGATMAYTAGLTVDVAAILARSSTRAAAAAEARQSDLNLLWQEWQTVAKARLLFVKTRAIAQSLALLQGQRAALAERLARTRIAVDRGLITSDAASPQLAALQDVVRQANDLERQQDQARHDLDALLGLAPEVVLQLVDAPGLPEFDAAAVQAALASATQRRPDLLALQAGYEAQDDRYRGALRAQFPAITLGPTRARDTSNVNTAGVSLGITLPLFNRNRGNIAIEQATRQKLRLDYQQRLDATVGDVDRLMSAARILQRQGPELDAAIDELAGAAQRAGQAFMQRNGDALTLTNAEAALLAKQLERVALAQSSWEQWIALQALLGGEVGPAPEALDLSSEHLHESPR